MNASLLGLALVLIHAQGDSDIKQDTIIHRPDRRDTAKTRPDRGYIKFTTLPEVTSADLVVKIHGKPERIGAKVREIRDHRKVWQAYFGLQKNQETHYCLTFKSGDKDYWYGPNGIYRAEGKQGDFLQAISAFELPKVHAWAPDAIFYQIFPDRFYNGNPGNDPKDVQAWDAPPNRSWKGGDLVGITKKLDYLHDLGINALYLNPIFVAGANHAYDTFDYLNVDPRFGTNDDLKTLVAEAHKRGIKVVLDAVFNHSGTQFFAFVDVRYKGELSDYKDWYFINKFPLRVEQGQKTYKTFGTSSYMPKLNCDNPEVRKFLLGVAKHWMEFADIDGWRLDVADEVSQDFWRVFRKEVLKIKPNALLINETWKDAHEWLQGDQQDSAMNYPWNDAVHHFFKGQIDSAEFETKLEQVRSEYPDAVLHSMYNMLDSHDTKRVLNDFAHDRAGVRLATAFQFAYPGMPSIYYGTEIGMEGERDPDCRRGMIWDESKWDQDQYLLTKTLTQARHISEALRRGSYQHLESGDPELFVFERKGKSDRVWCTFNRSMMPKVLKVPEAYEKGALLAEYGAALGEGEVVLSPMSFALIQSKVK